MKASKVTTNINKEDRFCMKSATPEALRKRGVFKGYLHYKMITSQNVLFEAQVQNFFFVS